MNDISLCTDRRCPSRRTCKRFTTSKLIYASYADFGRKKCQDKCADYIELFGHVKKNNWQKSENNSCEDYDLMP